MLAYLTLILTEIILIFATQGLDTDSLLQTCYHKPLKLEDARQDTFLETTFRIEGGRSIRHWLKNDNMPGKPPSVWRYAHFHSYMAFDQKRAIIYESLPSKGSLHGE